MIPITNETLLSPKVTGMSFFFSIGDSQRFTSECITVCIVGRTIHSLHVHVSFQEGKEHQIPSVNYKITQYRTGLK